MKSASSITPKMTKRHFSKFYAMLQTPRFLQLLQKPVTLSSSFFNLQLPIPHSVLLFLGAEWYKGHKLNMQWLTENSSLRRETKKGKGRNRLYVVCTACEQQKEAASKLSANGVVYAASGMLADSTEKLRRAVDHLLGRPHHAAVQAQKLCHMWHQRSDRHPWLHTLKRHDAETIKTLVRLAVDVYSDSKLEMVSARSWPCRFIYLFIGQYRHSSTMGWLF